MPNTFNPDDYLAKQATAQSPQKIAPQNAATLTGTQPTSNGFNPDAYLATKLNTKEGTEVLSQSSQAPISDEFGPITAFAQGASNAIVPTGMLNRVVKNSSMLSPESQALYDQGQAQIDKTAAAHPLAQLFGTGMGIVAGGVLGSEASQAMLPAMEKGLAALTADKVSEGALRGFGELALLSGEGGMFAVANDNPNTFEEGTKSFAKGSSIAGALGLGLKGVTSGIGALDEALTKQAKTAGLKKVGLAEQAASLKETQLTRAEEMAQRKVSELDATRSQLHRSQALLTAEPTINERVSTLPNKINDLLDRHINDVHGTVMGKIDLYKDHIVNPLPNFQQAIDKLESAKVYTPEAIAARDSALKFTRGLLSEAYLPGGSSQDVLVGSYQAPKATVDRLYKQNSQFGDLLYNRDFAKNAPSEVQQALKGLQKANRNLVAGVDPTGELSQYLDFEHSLLNAKQRDGFTQDAPDFFKQYAANKDDPTVMAKWRKFQRNLMDRSEIENQFGKAEAFDAGFKPETMQNPDLKQRAQNIRDLISSEVDPATTDYSVLKRVKSDVPKLQSRIDSLENTVERGTSLMEGRKLSKEKSLYALDQARQAVPQNAVEALLPLKLRMALGIRRNINNAIDTMKQSGDTLVGNPALQSGLMLLQGAARGSATKVPSMLGLTNSSD